MTRNVLEELLARDESVNRDDNKLVVADGASASLYASLGNEPLIIDRVATIVLEGEAVVVMTRRKERYLLGYEDVRAVRVAASERSAGY